LGDAAPAPADDHITDPATVATAVKTVEQVVAERGLVGLVNNAGVVKPGPLELQALLITSPRRLEGDLVGPLAVIQAFRPLIGCGAGPARCARSEQPERARALDRVAARCDVELAVDGHRVRLHRMARQVQALADLTVRKVSRQVRDDAQLRRRQG
jgi:hypothetical protein